jgi:hypothetical protein
VAETNKSNETYKQTDDWNERMIPKGAPRMWELFPEKIMRNEQKDCPR